MSNFPTNDERRSRAEAALNAYRIACCGTQDDECEIQDLITDLLHLLHLNSSDTDRAISAAVMNFESERDEDAISNEEG